MKELSVPRDVTENSYVVEVLRVWAEPGKPQGFIANGHMWKDPAAWGLMLSDIAKFVAGVYHSELGLDETAALERIRAGFKAER